MKLDLLSKTSTAKSTLRNQALPIMMLEEVKLAIIGLLLTLEILQAQYKSTISILESAHLRKKDSESRWLIQRLSLLQQLRLLLMDSLTLVNQELHHHLEILKVLPMESLLIK